MTRKRARNLSWTRTAPGHGPTVFQSVVTGPSVLVPLLDIDDTTRSQLLSLSADDAEFLGKSLVNLARAARYLADQC